MTGVREPLFSVDRLAIEPRAEPGRELLIEAFGITVSAGEAVGVVGETGAGKSLSMRACVGLLPDAIAAVAGSVRFGGQTLAATDTAALRARLGHGICLLPQNGRGALNPFLRVGQQIERVLGYRGVPRRQRAAEAATLLDAVGLPPGEFARRYPHQVSGGQAQRIAMVIALATDPKLLIADEPTTALDVTTERGVIRVLRQLCQDRAMGLVLITHNLGLVANNCDRVIIMHAGHIVEAGPVDIIFSRPAHPYTRALIAAIPDVDAVSDLQPLAGSVPQRGAMGIGCRLVDRCPEALASCRTTVPALAPFDHHFVRCHNRVADAAAPSREPEPTP